MYLRSAGGRFSKRVVLACAGRTDGCRSLLAGVVVVDVVGRGLSDVVMLWVGLGVVAE